MARVTYGAIITELAGSIGGITFQKNSSGNIAKLRSDTSTNPTPRQSPYHNNIASLVAYWPTVSAAHKLLWDAWAIAHLHTPPWGADKTISGYQWFMSINMNKLTGGSALTPYPPAWTAWAPVQSFTLVADATDLNIHFSPSYNPAAYIKIYLSLPLRQSSLKLRRSTFYVWAGSITSGIDNINITTTFENLVNVTWADFYASANCSIICRILRGERITGLYSSFISAIVKIG